MNKILFQEKQKFTQLWLWLLLIVISAVSIFSVIVSDTSVAKPKVAKNQFVQKLHEFAIDLSLPMTFMILVLIIVCLMLRLETSVTTEKIQLLYFPLLKRTYKWEDIESAEVITYGFVGYGIRFSVNHGTVYNIRGNQGLSILLKNGKKRLIGTQKPDELAKAIKKAKLSF